MNKVILLGRLTVDPEVRYTQTSNTLVASFGLAVERRFKQEGQPDVDFFNIVAWGKTGEFCSKYFKKGKPMALVGRLQTRKYEDRDGKTVYVTEVIVEEAEFGGKKEQNEFTPPEDTSSLPF